MDNVDAVSGQLQGFKLVMHCAGPFSASSKPMMEASIKAGAHHLDITGEIAVFELSQYRKWLTDSSELFTQKYR